MFMKHDSDEKNYDRRMSKVTAQSIEKWLEQTDC